METTTYLCTNTCHKNEIDIKQAGTHKLYISNKNLAASTTSGQIYLLDSLTNELFSLTYGVLSHKKSFNVSIFL